MGKVKSLAEQPWSELADFLEADDEGVLMPRCDLFDEDRYLEMNPDVATAVAAKNLASGRAHWLSHGKDEGRVFTETQWASPSNFASEAFDERRYLAENPDVASAVAMGTIGNAREHWDEYGRMEGRRFPARPVVPPVTEWATRRGLYQTLPPKSTSPTKGDLD